MLAAAIALVLLGWDRSSSDQESPAGGPVPTADAADVAPIDASTPADGSAMDALARLAVKGRAPRTGYTREQFGPSWRDVDRNGCDQRNDVLRRDLTDITVKTGTRGCVVLTGVLASPYSGEHVVFTRGVDTSRQVPIDHVVALSDAWQKGAQQWSAARRSEFANDFLVLRATDVRTNTAKSDRDAATWLPPLKSSRCGFVAHQIAIKAKYALWVTPAEHDAMTRVLGGCPEQGLPQSAPVLLGSS